LYLTSLGVTLSGVFAYYSVVESNVLRIPSLLFILNGHLISFLLREHKRKRVYSSFFLFSLLFLLFIDVFKGKGLLLFPPEAGGEPGLIIGDFLLWLVVLRSYTLFSPGYLLFSIVPSVAFLGLISAYSVDPELFLYTSLCFLFSILLLTFNSYEIGRFPALRSTLFTLGLFLFLLSVPLAFSLLIPLQKLSSALPTPQVYIRLRSFQRSDLSEGYPFLSNAVLLGGGLPRGNEVILELKGEPTPLLRQGTYEYFSGRYWVKNLFVYNPIRGQNGVFSISPIKSRFSKVSEEISFKETPISLVPSIGFFFGPFSPPFTGRRLYLLTPPNPIEIKFNINIAPSYILKGIDSSLSAIFFTREVITYEVISQPDIPWREPFISSIYLQKLPSAKTEELAKRITNGIKDDYQKAVAIQEYLRRNYSYRLSGAPSPMENGVEWFLFKSKKGDCDFFASAMCMLLREVGIPSRVAVGYSVSEYDPKRGVWIVRQRDAHMWVEAYIKGQGWLTFDPTPAGGSALYDFYLSLQRYYQLHKREIFPIFLFLTSTLLLFLLYRFALQEERRREKRQEDLREKLIRSFVSLCKRLARMGLPARKSSHTLREWLREIYPFVSPSFFEVIKGITYISEEVCYSREIEEERINIALKSIEELRRARRWQILNTSTS
jgi:transglutaminase-like putative cysteine protease